MVFVLSLLSEARPAGKSVFAPTVCTPPKPPDRLGYSIYKAPPTLAAVDKPQTANMERRRKRRRERRCFAISAASAPPPCRTSYCCGVIGGLSIVLKVILLVHLLVYPVITGQSIILARARPITNPD